MKIMSVIPAAAASSTAYWMSGLSTTGSISLGLALVTGRKRVPSPATGNTALVTLEMAIAIPAWWRIRASCARPAFARDIEAHGFATPASSADPPLSDQGHQLFFVDHRHSELARLVQFAARLRAGNHIAG